VGRRFFWIGTLLAGNIHTQNETNGHMNTPGIPRPFGLLFLFCLVALAAPGCRTNSHSDDVQVRFIDAVPEGGDLTVSVDGQRVWKNARFRSNTGYQGIGAGSYSVRVDSDGLGANSITSRPMAFEKGRRYTVLALGREGGAAARVFVLEDVASNAIPLGKAEVRLIQAAPGAGPVDLVVNNIVGVKAVRYGRRSEPLSLDRGSYDLKVVASDTPDTLAGPISLSLDAGHSYTLVTMGPSASGDLSLEAFPDGR